MSPAPAGRGNGLHAESYVPLADLQPYLADAVLDLLADEGIAAYAAPAGERRSNEIVVERVSRVLDRVHVDSSARTRAHALLEERREQLEAGPQARAPAPGPDAAGAHPADPAAPEDADGGGRAEDEELVWAALVQAYGEASASVGPWPAAEDLPQAGDPPPGRDEGTHDPGRPARVLRPAVPRPPMPPDEQAPHEEHFVPPPPPPLPVGDALTRWAWLGLLGTPVALFAVVLIGIEVAGWMLLLGVVAFVGGFVTLVVRMGDGPDDGDDGAVV